MHRRARHLNPAHAGATAALDARFISGVANGAAMSVWTTRPGGTLSPSQASAANQPTYSASAINGQPALTFDDGGAGANGKVLQASISLTQNNVTVIAVANKTGTSPSATYSRAVVTYNTANEPAAVGDYNSTNSMIFAQLANATQLEFNPAHSAWRNSTANPMVAFSYTLNRPIVSGTVLDGESVLLSQNGATKTGTTSSTPLNSNALRIGAAPALVDSNMLGHIARVDYLPLSVSAPLRRRLEQAAAFSFKLPCS